MSYHADETILPRLHSACRRASAMMRHYLARRQCIDDTTAAPTHDKRRAAASPAKWPTHFTHDDTCRHFRACRQRKKYRHRERQGIGAMRLKMQDIITFMMTVFGKMIDGGVPCLLNHISFPRGMSRLLLAQLSASANLIAQSASADDLLRKSRARVVSAINQPICAAASAHLHNNAASPVCL